MTLGFESTKKASLDTASTDAENNKARDGKMSIILFRASEGKRCQAIQVIGPCVRSFPGGHSLLESKLSPAHGGRLTYEGWDVAGASGILQRQWCALGAPGVLATLGSARLSLSPDRPCLPAGATQAWKRLTSTNSHHLCRVGKPHVLPQLLFMWHAGWVFSVVQPLGTR